MGKVAVSTLQGSTIDIINTIRANASPEYQAAIPEVATAAGIPKVGEVFRGYPQFANMFLESLVNRIGLVLINSKMYSDPYKELKKGTLPYGATIEETFVNLAKAREFSPEKAADREFKRTIPDVKTAFHTINYQVQYPISIENQELFQAFTSLEGVENLISKIVDSTYSAAEYDEQLMFKYLIIKGVTKGKMYPVSVGKGTDPSAIAKSFRSVSNKMTFMSPKFNSVGVHTFTDRDDQYLFMDSDTNASYDVDTLAGAFNMDKATFFGHLKLVDDWSTFDNDRFREIRENADNIEEVTQAELDLMKNVKGVLVDKEYFQVYDNQRYMTEKFIAAGSRWNYFYNVWQIIDSSPFSNAVVFVTDSADIAAPANVTVEITDKSVSENSIVLTVEPQLDAATIANHNVKFIQSEALANAGIAVHPYGAYIIPASQFDTAITVVAEIDGVQYTDATTIKSTANVGDTLTLAKG